MLCDLGQDGNAICVEGLQQIQWIAGLPYGVQLPQLTVECKLWGWNNWNGTKGGSMVVVCSCSKEFRNETILT